MEEREKCVQVYMRESGKEGDGRSEGEGGGRESDATGHTHMVSCYGSPQVNQDTYPLIVTVSGYFLYKFLFVSLFLHLK